MPDKLLRAHLLEILDGKTVHCGIKEAVQGVPLKFWGKKFRSLPYTLYELIEHIRLSIRDILEYIANPNYEVGQWPEEYWPKIKKPKNSQEIKNCLRGLFEDIDAVRKLIQQNEPLELLPFGKKKHTLAREVMILSNHLAYHLGQMIVLRRLLGIWQEE